tara:strand:+ start:69899 stop:70183 length:285 start_codon:yes stop_codon:yes gene_type:complete
MEYWRNRQRIGLLIRWFWVRVPGAPQNIVTKGENMSNSQIAKVCFWSSLVSVIGSIAVWSLTGDTDPAHAERFGIFVGLWAPTLMGLANWFREQ